MRADAQPFVAQRPCARVQSELDGWYLGPHPNAVHPSAMRAQRSLSLTATWVMLSTLAGARTADAQLSLRPRSRGFWIGAAAAVTAAGLADERAQRFSLAHRSGLARTFADAGNAMGTGRNVIAGLALTYVGARLTGHRSAANDVLRISAGYAVSNAVVGVLKPVVGRHRPDSTNDAWRFRTFSSRGEWHAFASSHAVHAFSVAAGIAVASRDPLASTLGYSTATLVAWSRLYDNQHWASDVTSAAVIGVSSAATMVRWLERRYPDHE
jgi:membrane-associated phospholipid phosphatase